MALHSVLHIVRPADGGMRRHVNTLVKGLVEKGINVHIACPEIDEMIKEFAENGAWVHAVPLKGPINFREDIACILRLKSIISQGDFDIIHCHGSKAGMVGRIAAFSEGHRNVVVTIHNFIIYDEVSTIRKLMYVYGEKLLRHATARFITVSRALKNDLITRFNVPENIVTSIYNGIDIPSSDHVTDVRAIRKRMNIPDGYIVGTVARMAPQKGLEYLLKAIPLITQKINAAFVIGGDGPLMPALKKMASDLKLENSLLFTGYVDNVTDLLRCFDVFVVPSIAEGLSITTIEAMAAGLPVVASNTGGLPELVKDGVTGYLVNPRDYISIANAIINLFQNKPLMNKMGENGQIMAMGLFNNSHMVDDTFDLYNELLEYKLKEPAIISDDLH